LNTSFFFVNGGSFFENQTVLYFDKPDVEKAIHATTNVSWVECSQLDVFSNGYPRPAQCYREEQQDGYGLADFILIAEG